VSSEPGLRFRCGRELTEVGREVTRATGRMLGSVLELTIVFGADVERRADSCRAASAGQHLPVAGFQRCPQPSRRRL